MKKTLTLVALALNLCLYAQPGALDTTFNPGSGANDVVYTTAIQNDGKIVIGGTFTTFNGIGRECIVRLNIDGSLDLTFNPSSRAKGGVLASAIQSDGKIVIAGGINNVITFYSITRLNTNGTTDTAFNPGTGANSIIYSTIVQNDGKILIGGGFHNYNGSPRLRIARLNINGSLDTSFNPGTGTNDIVVAFALQNDGKIIMGGGFTTYNGKVIRCIARLNTNGSLDTTFNIGTGVYGYLTAVALQNDGKIIIGGDFTAYNGTARNRIARLNTDGSLDTTFNPGVGANNNVRSISLQNDGKIIIGGEFTTYNGITRSKIARLNSDGSLDTSFNIGIGASSTVWASVLQNDGKLIIGGNFTTYNGTVKNGVARLWGGSVSGVGIAGINTADLAFRMYPNPAAQLITIESDIKEEVKIEVVEITGKIVLSAYMVEKKTIDVSTLAPSMYIVKLISKNGSVERRFVKTGL